ncbi:hypothetical protein ACVBEQ_08095 [Nakamurella sp. GG22]
MRTPQDLDEWSLAGLTREQGFARWSALFVGTPSASQMILRTSWGWLEWAAADPETAQVARLAGRIPPPVLVAVAVRDPDSRVGRPWPAGTADPVTTSTWGAMAGLIGGGVAGVWWWGVQVLTLVLAVAVAAGAAGMTALWHSWTASRRPAFRILTERDSAVVDVFAGAKVLTWATDQIRIHEAALPQQATVDGAKSAGCPPEFGEAIDELHHALWALATGRADDPPGTIAAMTDYARLVLQLLDAREQVQRASTVRVAPPADRSTVREPAVERLREAAKRLEDAIEGQRHAATVVGDVNRRFDEPG